MIEMDIKVLQLRLYKWLLSIPNRPVHYNKIRLSCIQLYNQCFPDKDAKNAFYLIAFPLMRMGLIEFYGANKYDLAPSVFLSKKKTIIGFNIPESFDEPVNGEGFNYLRLKKNEEVLSKIHDTNIPLREFDLYAILKQVPNIKKIISSNLLDEQMLEMKGFQFLSMKNQWGAVPPDNPVGLYRSKDLVYANRYLKSENEWYKISDQSKNPDAFNMAALYAKILQDESIEVVFNEEKGILEINNFRFPILLERLLFINSILEGTSANYTDRRYLIDYRAMKQLNRILLNKIEYR